MRAGGNTVAQQSLTPEASAIVKQAVSLARRRGHAQVTPLHVATTMLSIPTGLLRSTCLQSHSQSHPLRCKALDLCFNVALNRLPSVSQILMGPYHAHHQSPSLSNALVAAFKRAQAHQRRGSSVDAQQQPVVAVRIDVEQLIISILDDPSVSRVMKEAGFSSTQVKANVENTVSLEMSTPQRPNPNPNSTETIQGGNIKSADVMTVVEVLIRRQKKSVVIVGERLATSEAAVRGLMDGTSKGELPAEDLKNLQFITVLLSSFLKMSREEIEQKIDELKFLVRSCSVGRGLVLYLGDLKWMADYWLDCKERRESLYCIIESVLKEIGNLVHGGFDVWLMAIATQQTYLRCKAGNPSLETILGLEPLAIPAVSLDLSLNSDSPHGQLRSNENMLSWPQLDDGIRNGLVSSSAASPCNANSSSVLPPWLLQHKEESKRAATNNLVSLHEKGQFNWDSVMNSGDRPEHHLSGKTLDFSSVSPNASSPSASLQIHQASSGSPKSTSSTESIEVEYQPRFKEVNAENLKTLCNSLEKVSCQKEIIPNIASTILQCRSGMRRRKEGISAGIKEETWLFFLGSDTESKERIARGLAAMVFGSHANFISVGLSEFSSSGDPGSKRSRVEASSSYLERFASAVLENPHRVFLLEDIEHLDYYSQLGILDSVKSGVLQSSVGEGVGNSDAILILSCEKFDSRSRGCSPPIKQKTGSNEERDGTCEEEINSTVGFDLNLIAECREEDSSFDDVGLLEAVDGTFFFKLSDV